MNFKLPEQLKSLVRKKPVEPTEIKLEEFVPKKGNPIVIGKAIVIDKDIEISNTEIQLDFQEQWFICSKLCSCFTLKKSY